MAKRKLRLALAGARSPREAAREITKRLTGIAGARSFVTWRNRKAPVTDPETQRRAIVGQIGSSSFVCAFAVERTPGSSGRRFGFADFGAWAV
ncbi:MAG: DUF6880 family protein [Rhodosalinus sp.]